MSAAVYTSRFYHSHSRVSFRKLKIVVPKLRARVKPKSYRRPKAVRRFVSVRRNNRKRKTEPHLDRRAF